MNPIPHMAGWERAAQLVAIEAIQLKEEGRDPQWIDKALAGVDIKKDDDDAWAALWTRLQEAPMRSDFAFVEPSDLPGIHAERVAATRQLSLSLSDQVLSDRMLGAWLGRCCGCALGKPVEGFMVNYAGLTSRQRIKSYLLGCPGDEYPLRNYFPGTSSAQATTGALICPQSTREVIAHMETNDDIRYTVLGQKVLMEKGAAFTTRDVMETWINELPYALVCTAEMQAYRNFVARYRVSPCYDPTPLDIDWLWVATNQNPYREWIGAQIRADSWGYAAPGNPELAADFAWRDARMSHISNGIYGEMFVAAMIAAGFALDDPLKVVQAGLAEIPRRSRCTRK